MAGPIFFLNHLETVFLFFLIGELTNKLLVFFFSARTALVYYIFTPNYAGFKAIFLQRLLFQEF